MTLNQLKYVSTVAVSSSISEAAETLFITQPSLTASIHALEKEFGITIFYRTNKGITLTPEGEEFLGYARQILEETKFMEERYKGLNVGKRKFSVSTQHYSFAVEAFVDLLKSYDNDEYEFHFRETQTYSIIEDVAQMRSEIGILYINPFNKTIITRALKEHELKFTSLFKAEPHVFISKKNPLAAKDSLTLKDLEPYPRLSYEQGEHNSFYYSEELQSSLPHSKDIVVTDRATLFNLVIGFNGYTICSGVINSELNSAEIISRPLKINDHMDIGYITHKKLKPSRLAEKYIESLKVRSLGKCSL